MEYFVGFRDQQQLKFLQEMRILSKKERVAMAEAEQISTAIVQWRREEKRRRWEEREKV